MATTKLSTVIDKADRLASQAIRRKYADQDGNVTCITCGKVLPWKEAHCAHYVERAHKNTRWIEENLHPACPSCNVYRKEFHKRRYTLYLIDMYGREKVDELEEEGRKVISGPETRAMAEYWIEYYSKLLERL